MKNNYLQHNTDIMTRASNMISEIKSGKKLQHTMINSSVDFQDIQDLYLNSLSEWLRNPKFEIILNSKGNKY